MNARLKNLSLISLSLLLLVGCGSNSTKSGVLIDDVVSGIKYVNGDNTGFTDAQGKFPYKDGAVEFYLGKIKIGQIDSLTADSKIFIQDIVGVDRTNTEDEKVLKIATLLQSLDSDTSTDAIEVSKEDFDKFEVNDTTIDEIDVNTLLDEKKIKKVSQTDVKRHLNNVLKSYGEIVDETVLEIETTSVADKDSNVEYDSSFEIEFTKDIKKDDVTKEIFVLKDSEGNAVDYELEYDFDTVEITPTENLIESKEYTLTIKTSMIKNYDEQNRDDVNINFTAKTVKPALQTNMDQSKNVTTNDSKWTFSGMLRDDNGIESSTITVNGISTNIQLENEFFDIEQDLNAGENSYKISAIDVEGNESVVEGVITYNANSVEDYIVKTNVKDTELVSLSSIWNFNGEVNTQSTLSKLTLNFNGQSEDIQVVENKFSLNKQLKLGSNSFKISAQDDTGKKEDVTGTIFYGNTTAAGGSHSAALKGNDLYTWGRNNYGQSGLGYTSSVFIPNENVTHPITPMKVNTPTNFVSLSFMQNFSVAIDENGDVYTWGYDKNGELGRGKDNRDNCSKTEDCRLTIAKVDGLSNIVAIDAGLSHTLALDKNGDVYGFGTNGDGELGDGTKVSNAVPVKVVFPEDNVKIKQVTTGSDFSIAIDTDGQLWAWGRNNYGQSGQGNDDDDQLVPVKVTLGDNEKAKSASAGTGHILALTESGNVYAWGSNSLSQIGYNGYSFKNSKNVWEREIHTPTKIITNYKNNPVVQVHAGGHSSYILRADGKVYPWGMYGETEADGGQNYQNPDYPEDKLTAITSVKNMAAGALHVSATKEDNTVFTWRWSFEGSLGGGESTANIWFYNYPIIPVFPQD